METLPPFYMQNSAYQYRNTDTVMREFMMLVSK